MSQLTLDIKELNQDMLGNVETIRKNSQRGEEIVKIQLNKLVIREGFNVRTDYGDIEGLAQSIIENGQTVAGRVDVLEDGRFLLVEGHRRVQALFLLKEQGNDVVFKAIVNGKKTSEEQRIIQMFTTQDSKPLLPHEMAELFRRLVNLGYTPTEVASKVGKTYSYVSQMLSYANESKEVKDEVEKGNIAVSTVVKLQKTITSPTERKEAIKKTISENKVGKVTAEKVEKMSGRDPKEMMATKIANAVFDQFVIVNSSCPISIKELIGIISPYC